MTTTLNPWQVLAIEQGLRGMLARDQVEVLSARALLALLALLDKSKTIKVKT